MKIAVIGAGAWGTALALAAGRAGHEVVLWGRDRDVIGQIQFDNLNRRYLPGIALDPAPMASIDLAAALEDAAIALLSVPAQQVVTLTREMKPVLPASCVIVCCSKGIDRATGALPCEIVSAGAPGNSVAALSGPSFAVDVARGLPTAVTIAAADGELADRLASQLSSAQFRCYSNVDLKGVELGGALKNVIALAVGAARGLRLGASAEAALIARGFAEITRLAVSKGARAETLSGLSGLGDLVLTCSSAQSRNFSFGVALGRGEPPDETKLAEGAFTARIAARLAQSQSVETPIIQAVADVLDRQITPNEAVQRLLERPLRRES